MMARESHTTPLLCREVVRENRVNQSGSVALSTEAMRGPAWRNLLIIMALLTQKIRLRTRGSWVQILPDAPDNHSQVTAAICGPSRRAEHLGARQPGLDHRARRVGQDQNRHLIQNKG